MATATTDSADISGSATSTIFSDSNSNSSNSAASGSAQTLRKISVDNTAGATEDVHLKIYDNASPVIGTTEPDTILRCRKGERLEVTYTGTGYVLGTALSWVVTQEAGKPAESNASTDPSAPVAVAMGAT